MGAMGPPPDESSLERALGQVGDRWTLLVVHALLGGAKRFGELSEVLPGIAPNVLSGRLKRLEREGIVVAHPYSTRPPRFAYDLSAAGRELGGALRPLAAWGAGRAGDEEGLRHGACGTPVETRWWCPTCEHVVEDDEGDDVRFV